MFLKIRCSWGREETITFKCLFSSQNYLQPFQLECVDYVSCMGLSVFIIFGEGIPGVPLGEIILYCVGDEGCDLVLALPLAAATRAKILSWMHHELVPGLCPIHQELSEILGMG